MSYNTSKTIQQILLYICISIIGIGALYFATIQFNSNQKFVKSAIITTGTVVDMRLANNDSNGTHTSSRKHSSKTYAPVISFTTENGKRHKITTSTSSSLKSYDIGDKIKVIFNPLHPSDGKVYSILSIYGFAIVPGTFGIISVLIGVSMILMIIIKNNPEVLKDLAKTEIFIGIFSFFDIILILFMYSYFQNKKFTFHIFIYSNTSWLALIAFILSFSIIGMIFSIFSPNRGVSAKLIRVKVTPLRVEKGVTISGYEYTFQDSFSKIYRLITEKDNFLQEGTNYFIRFKGEQVIAVKK